MNLIPSGSVGMVRILRLHSLVAVEVFGDTLLLFRAVTCE